MGPVQELIQNTISKISPEVGKDFQLANRLYQNFSKTAQTMKPRIADQLAMFTEGGAFFMSLLRGDMTSMAGIVGEHAARRFAQKMVTDPRLQSLTRKMANAIDSGQVVIADKLMKQLRRTNKDKKIDELLGQVDFKQVANQPETPQRNPTKNNQ